MKLPNLHILIKQKSPLLPKNLALRTFGELLIVFLTKINLLYLLPLLNSTGVLSSASDKAKLFAENFSENSNLGYSGISLPVFPSRMSLKLHNFFVTPKMFKKVIINLDLSKTSGPDCVPVAVQKNCEPELSYIPAELFNECLKESCFAGCWKVSSVVPVYKNVGERSTATTLLVFFLLLIKSLKNL